MDKVRFVSEPVEMEYTRSPGKILGHFFARMRDEGTLMAIRCSNCSQVFLPPQQFCPECTHKMTNFVEVPSEGRIASFTVMRKDSPFCELTAPYSYVAVQFEGVDSLFWHFCKDTEDLRAGDRVRAVFKSMDDREGSLLDLLYFERVRES